MRCDLQVAHHRVFLLSRTFGGRGSESYEQPGTPSGLANSSITSQILADLSASISAHKSINASFKLATCGWAVGPSDQPALLDQVLPPEVTFLSAIGKRLGWDPVQPGFAMIKKRPSMVIPWMEDDHYLVGAEFWYEASNQATSKH